MAGVEERIAALPGMSSDELRQLWGKVTGTPAPRISPKLLRLALAWEFQACAHGGLSRSTQQRLAQLSQGKTKTGITRPGMRLVREWNGEAHVITIGEDKVIRWKDKEWGSLSEVARAITGTRWSGPAFFGLKKRIAA